MAAAGRHSAAAVSAYLFLLALMMYFAVGDLFLRHHDLGWHLATGDLIRILGKIPSTDPWSFSAQGYPWLNMAWLWDIAMSAVYGAGGMGGVIAVTVLVGAGVCALLAAMCLRAAGILPTALGVAWVGIALPLYQGPLDYALAAAPQAASLLMFMLFWCALDTAVWRGNKKFLWPLPFLMCLWANMHGAFLLAWPLLAAYAAAAWWNKEHGWLRAIMYVSLACAAAMLVNPLGIHIIDAALRTLTGPASGSISEFLPFAFGREPLSSLYLLAAIFLIDWRNEKIPLAGRLLAMAFLVLGLCQTRSFCYFMFTSLPLLLASVAPKIEPWLSSAEARCVEDSADPKTARRMLIACFAAALLLWPAAQLRWPQGTTFPADIAPLAEIDYIAAHYPGEKIYNHWNLGGFVIFETRGKMPVLIDGRGGTAYPPEVLAPLVGYNHEQEIVDRYHLKVALMPRYLPPQLTYFETSPQWKRAMEGKVANVYVRCNAAKSCH